MFIILFFIILISLVLIHEFGHFIVAKKNGVRVEEFGIGFPPRIFGIKIGETLYSLNLLPLGGFVKLFGEEYHELPENQAQIHSSKAFVNKKPWQKVSIIVAGVIAHFLLGWILITYLFTQGIPSSINKVKVEKVNAQSPASLAGLQSGDLITGLVYKGKTFPITNTDELKKLSTRHAGEKVLFNIETVGKEKKVTIVPRVVTRPNEGALGIVISQAFIIKKYPLYEAPYYGLKEAATITYKVLGELGRAVSNLVTTGKTGMDVTGPIGIARYTKEAAQTSINALIELIALLALNLAVINILPFPALDGGRLIFIIYEWITKKRVNTNFERYLNLAGFVLLLTLAGVITYHDIIRFR